jgi:TfoX/Sxy family transcriptional regulator of competence genes
MAYNEQLTNRLREALTTVPKVEEKRMFRGVTFMVNDKMCISAGDNRIMCRIDPERHEEALSRRGCTTVKMKGRDYIGYVHVTEDGFQSKKDFDYWVALCLDFNKKAKASPKKKKKKK